MSSKLLTAIAAAVIVVVVCLGAFASCGVASGGLTTGCSGGSLNPSAGHTGVLTRVDGEQLGNVATIISVGIGKDVPPWGWVVAVATALQESNLRNLPHLGAVNDHDSIGLFQQRPSQGWGTPEQLVDPAYQAGKFFDALLRVPGWQIMPLADAADAVQKSAHPGAYAAHASDAIVLVTAVAPATESGGPVLPGCVPSAGGAWTQPVHAPVVSGFRTSARPTHDGYDLAAARNTIIVAASAGTVTMVACNAHSVDGSPWGCDRDGDPARTVGCGWYVDVAHAGGILTRYCHMQTRPFVQVGDSVVAGQHIGLVGSTGHSSGPHLHFEIHVGGDASSAGAIDPGPFMAANGAPLGQ